VMEHALDDFEFISADQLAEQIQNWATSPDLGIIDGAHRELVKPALALLAPTPERKPAEPLDLAKAFWLSPRAKRQIERDRIAAAHKAAVKRALRPTLESE